MSRGQIVGRNIVIARKLAGMSQAQLGRLVGAPANYLSEWEAGKHEPRAARLEKLAEVLEQPLWWFYMDHTEDDGAEARRRTSAA
jgi:transcriptional regulator with XRE-family HTH domain